MLEADAITSRPRPRPSLSPRPKLKRPNRTLGLYFTVKIYAIKHCAIINAIISLIIVNAF